MDISHRGGRPGFVRVDQDTLTIPDFAGNRYFNTLGNTLLYPRASLLFPGFPHGDVLQVQGCTEIVWEVPENERMTGAERLWRLKVSEHGLVAMHCRCDGRCEGCRRALHGLETGSVLFAVVVCVAGSVFLCKTKGVARRPA